MNLRGVYKQTCANLLAGNTTLITSDPGVGKTDLMAKVARWWHAQHSGKRVGYSTFFMATQSPIGFTGLPWKSTLKHGDKEWTITDPAIPEWYMAYDMETGKRLPASEFETVLLVIEEWGQGSPDTKRAAAEVLRAGGTPPFYLPPGSGRIALSNVDARDGVLKDFDFLINRRGVLHAEGDFDVWDQDFASFPYEWQGKQWTVMPETRAWAKQNPNLLFEKRPDKQAPWGTARSVTNADRYVQAITEMNGGKIPIEDPDFTSAIAGHVGMPVARSYVATLQFSLELPSLEDVVANPLDTPVPNRADLQMLMSYGLAARVQPDQLGPVIEYMSKDGKPRMPKDMAITFISSLIRRDYKRFINVPAMTAWVHKNAYLVSAVTALSKA